MDEGKVRTFGLEYYGRYYSLYKGFVKANADPQGQGRIRVSVPELGRDETLEAYAYPVASFSGKSCGIFFPPEVGDTVWVMFEGGNPTLPIYLGGWWLNPSKTPGGSHVPPDLNPGGLSPTVRGIQTKAGHRIIFDDGPDGGITIQSPAGTIIRLKDAEESIEILASRDVAIRCSTARVEATTVDVNASAVNIVGSVVRINSGSKVAAAVGDSVVAGPHSGTVTGPPVGGRPLIP